MNQLNIRTTKGVRTINLDNSFFTSSQVLRRGQIVVLTPAVKARDLAHDLSDGQLKGYSLYNNGKEIINYEEDARPTQPAKVLESRGNVNNGRKPYRKEVVNPNQNLGSSR